MNKADPDKATLRLYKRFTSTVSWFQDKTLMSLACVALLGILSACTSHIEPYPANWPPPPPRPLGDCAGVVGMYQDGPRSGGNVGTTPATWALNFPSWKLRLEDKSVGSRRIAVSFDSANNLHLDYFIDGQPVAEQVFASSDYRCQANGVLVTLHYRISTGVFNMLPNWGRYRMSALLYRIDEHLYVRRTDDVKALILYLIPDWAYSESWARFVAAKERDGRVRHISLRVSNSPITSPTRF
jgi:hypothetical protein